MFMDLPVDAKTLDMDVTVIHGSTVTGNGGRVNTASALTCLARTST